MKRINEESYFELDFEDFALVLLQTRKTIPQQQDPCSLFCEFYSKTKCLV